MSDSRNGFGFSSRRTAFEPVKNRRKTSTNPELSKRVLKTRLRSPTETTKNRRPEVHLRKEDFTITINTYLRNRSELC